MIEYRRPVSVVHRGSPIVFALGSAPGESTARVYYNVLQPTIEVANDQTSWSGYQELPRPAELAPAGMSLLRTVGGADAPAALAAVTDTQFIYVFVSSPGAVRVSRYVLVEVPAANTKAGTQTALQPAWEVRYQRSGKADLPAGEHDVLSARSPEGDAYLEPAYELPIGGVPDDVDPTSLAVLLVPSGDGGSLRWQMFLRKVDGTIACYSFDRTADGLFAVDAAQLDAAGRIAPDATVTLTQGGAVIRATGPLAVCTYAKQEEVATTGSGVVSIKRTNRVMLGVPTVAKGASGDAPCMATVDFALGKDGSLSGIARGAGAVTYACGVVAPTPFALSYDGTDAAGVPAAKGIALPTTFTLEAWIRPQGAGLLPQLVVAGTGTGAARSWGLWITDQLRVAATYQDTIGLHVVSTRDNVLALGSWTHVAVAAGPDGMTVYVNGVAATLASPPSFTGPIAPSGVAIGGAPAGAVVAGGVERTAAPLAPFSGLLREVRIWSKTLGAADIVKYLYSEIPDAVVKNTPEIVGYWRCDAGEGTVAIDTSKYGRDADLSGPSWVAEASPMTGHGDAAIYLDARGLATYVGLLLPAEGHPLFVDLAPGTRPALLDGADGLVHLYFRDGKGQLSAAHYDAGIDRARYVFPWVAAATSASPEQRGTISFLARQSGTALNGATLTATPDPTPFLCTLTLADGHGTTETWRGVPARADAMTAVLSGGGMSSPATFASGGSLRPFYDYGGKRRIGVQPIDAPARTALWLLADRTSDFVAESLALSNVQGGAGDVALVVSSDSAHPGETIAVALAAVPVNAESFAETLSGRSDVFAYAQPDDPSLTKAYTLATTSGALVFVVPAASRVSGASFTVTAGKDGGRCDVAIALTADGVKLSAAWSNVPRDVGGFVDVLRASTDAPAKEIVALLRFAVSGGGAVLDGAATGPSVAPLLSFLVIVNDGGTGALAAFSVALSVAQGAGSTDPLAALDGGSRLFAVTVDGGSTNGHPAAVAFDGHPKLAAALARAGRNGGWVYEPPRIAVKIVPKGLLSAAVTAPGMAALDLPDELTLEAWVKLDAATPSQTSYYPRVVHANLTGAARPTRYFLGLRAGRCLQMTAKTAVRTDDAAVADPAMTLFPNGLENTVQLYLNPDLSTVVGPNTVYARTTDRGRETLTVGTTGLVFAVTLGGTVETAPLALVDRTWQRVTLIRTRQLVTVQLDWISPETGQPMSRSTTLKGPPSIASSHSAIALGGNDSDASLQAQLSTFSVWTRALLADELAVGFNVPLDPSTRGLQLLWGLDGDLGDQRVDNVAQATEGYYDTAYTGPHTYWAYPGLFHRMFFAHGSRAVMSRYAVTGAHQWRNFGASYRARYGITISDGRYADCGNDGSFDVSSALTIEAWIRPSLPKTGHRQAIVSKLGDRPELRSYEIGIDPTFRPYLALRIDGLTRPSGNPAFERDSVLTFTSPQPLAADTACYLAATVSIASFADMGDDLALGTVYSSVVGQLYVDGVPTIDGPSKPAPLPNTTEPTYALNVIGGSGSGRYVAGAKVTVAASDRATFSRWRISQMGVAPAGDLTKASLTITMPARDVTMSATGTRDAISITKSTTPVTMGRASTSDGQGTAFYTGGLSDVRIWSAELSRETIQTAFATHVAPSADKNRVSFYDFREQRGRIAFDSQSNNNARLSSGRMWTTFEEGAVLKLWMDAVPIPADPVAVDALGPYGPAQFRVGGALDDNGVFRNPLVGTIDELRIWSTVRTAEQIADNLYSYQSGNEAGLVGYWNFSAGTGRFAADDTVNGNDLAFENAASAAPSWVASTAPVASEAPPVYNVLGGLVTPDIATIQGDPIAFEYGETQRDSNGAAFAVMKRGYAYVASSGLKLFTGYHVGDLRMVYIGQIQTRPSLIGYVEGAPPLPSENLTRPYYEDPIGAYFQYEGIASVALSQSAGTEVTVRSGRNDSRGIETTATVGVSGDDTVLTGIGAIGPIVLTQDVKYTWRAGVKASLNWSSEASSERAITQSYNRTATMEMTNGGNWEPPDQPPLLKSAERRFLVDNVGCAVVKSATADLFGLFLASTGTLVSYSVVPNPDIPIDTNLIYFPINPAYVSNGSLDGRVGLQSDPAAHGGVSYFDPRDAYALQRTIERETARLQAFYDQIDAPGRASAQRSSIDDLVGSAPYYDWQGDVPRKSIANKYVWTAAGGLYKEQEEYGTQREESFGGAYALDWRLGAAGSIEGDVGPVGLFFEAELLGGTGWTVTVEKGKNESRAIALDVSLDNERCLRKYVVGGSPPFSVDPVPGKVDSYRFMSFYLAPKTSNTDRFFDTVVDPTWLELSTDPRAVALREARAISAGQSSWRVLHRVTYVSRVPPPFQAVPVVSDMPPLAPPVRIADNAFFLELVDLELTKAKAPRPPTPAAIGGAVSAVLSAGLGRILPWWSAFLERASTPNSPDALTLAALRVDLLAYATEYYRSLAV